jgi:Fe-S oxidoreductase
MDLHIKTMAEYAAEGKSPEVLFWVGCAGSFDDRAKKITKAFAKILNKVGVEFAVLGQEESCTGDPAKRAGNEFVFQMMAYQYRNSKCLRSKENRNGLSTLFQYFEK